MHVFSIHLLPYTWFNSQTNERNNNNIQPVFQAIELGKFVNEEKKIFFEINRKIVCVRVAYKIVCKVVYFYPKPCENEDVCIALRYIHKSKWKKFIQIIFIFYNRKKGKSEKSIKKMKNCTWIIKRKEDLKLSEWFIEENVKIFHSSKPFFHTLKDF